ncbi:MAG TPA: hypothetical protein PKH10_02085 [bacterium]|nr:hypothetical protein [bacterium]
MMRVFGIFAVSTVLFFFAACDKKETAATDDLTTDETVDDDDGTDQTLLEGDEGESDQSDTSDISDNMVDEDSALSDDLLADDQPGPTDETDGSDQSDDISPDEDLAGLVLPAETTCQPSAAPCDAAPVETNIYASYRKDFYYPNYQEGDVINPIPAPTSGGRFQITGIAGKGGTVTAVKLNGVNVADLLTQTKLDWYHVYPLTLTEGEAFWVNFHSREASWDSASNGQLTVETGEGTAFSGPFNYAVNQVPLKYVAFADDYQTLIIHIENRTQNPVTLTKLLYNGRDVTAAACMAGDILQPNVNMLITVPLCEAVSPGDPWTVTALVNGIGPSTAGGRVIRDFYPIETWQSDDECPYYPGYNEAWYTDHRAHGFDTFFMRPTSAGECSSNFPGGTGDIYELLGPIFEQYGLQAVLTFEANNQFLDYTDVSNIAVAFHADECDDNLLDNGYPKPETRAQYARRTWETWPDLPTYIGGSRGRYNGAFAGATDIQGFDYYVAACAPHITVAGTHPPLRGAFDQLLLVHENHMPHTTWAYTQGLHNGSWNATIPGIGTKVYRQPTPAEFRIQALSVLMVGSKGIMYFQTDKEMVDMFPATWEEIGKTNREIHGLKPYLREGDIHAIIQQEGQFIASVIRSREMMALVLFSTHVTNTPTEQQCLTAQNVHWAWGDTTLVTVPVAVPPEFPVAEVWELRDGQFLPANYSVNGRTVTFPDIALNEQNVGRIFVLISDPAIKDDMLGRMEY